MLWVRFEKVLRRWRCGCGWKGGLWDFDRVCCRVGRNLFEEGWYGISLALSLVVAMRYLCELPERGIEIEVCLYCKVWIFENEGY